MELRYIFLLLAFASCNSTPDNTSHENEIPRSVKQVDPLLEKYSGGYYVDVAGVPSNDVMESYVLSKDGSAKWLYIVNDGANGAKVDSKKYGTWTVTENEITINIQGNTGLITEKYILSNGVFRDDLTGKRQLKLTP